MRCFCLLTAAFVFQLAVASVPAAAQDENVAPAALSEDEKAIRKVAESYLDAFHRADADAMASHWAKDGDFVDIHGRRTVGVENIRQAFADFFARNRGARLSIDMGRIRMIAPDVAIEDGTASVSPPPAGDVGKARYTIIYVKRDGKWLVDSMRDVAIEENSNYNELRELEWMIGEWADKVGEGDPHAVHSTCQWTVNKNFIIREFVSHLRGDIALRGTQIIGYDPQLRRIRSWVFDSDGDFFEGTWTRKDNRWTVRESGVLRDGRAVKSVRTITRVDNDTVIVHSTQRSADGQPLPDVPPVTIHRKKSPTPGDSEEMGMRRSE